MKILGLQRVAFVVLLLASHGIASAWSADHANWVSTWGAAPDSAGPALPAQTIRQIIRTSAGGSQVRVRLSNLFGSAPLVIGTAHIAARAGGPDIRAGSGRPLTFNGSSSVVIAKGESVLSDAAAMEVGALQELAVSIYLPAGSGPSTIHGAGMQTAYTALREDSTHATVFPAGATDDSRYFLTDVQVAADSAAGTIVVVGDSIVDGIGSTQDRNTRWPDVLAQELQRDRGHPQVAVVNAGIAGNRILLDGAKPFVGPSALARFERDALAKPGVRWIVLAQGINDIVASDMLADPAQQVSAEQIIDGMRRLVRRAQGQGIKVWGATLLPLGGVRKPFIHSPAGEAKRQAINAWIRSSGEFDAVLDFDQLMRDPAQPDRLLPQFDSGDHLHPNDAGYHAMGRAARALWMGSGAGRQDQAQLR